MVIGYSDLEYLPHPRGKLEDPKRSKLLVRCPCSSLRIYGNDQLSRTSGCQCKHLLEHY